MNALGDTTARANPNLVVVTGLPSQTPTQLRPSLTSNSHMSVSKTMEAIASLVTSAVLLLWQTYLNSRLTSYTMATISSYFGPGSCRRPDPERVILDPTYLNPRPNDHDGILIEPDEFERNGKQYVRYSVR
ncbi:Uncharacterized protein HZ326_12849 [Fusarium oxysporum f. sp. albedinis]|nr:Uncharacterized protein HZ326_12849 [Fusarium oxysporum f. sp. albedinis]